jgi:RNA polymerase sigma-70 factor (ECF subfamily)
MLTFNQLYETYAEEVFRYAYWLSGNRAWAEDIASETMIRAWTHFRPIRTETLKAYLFTIARNYYLGQLRKENRLVELEEELLDPAHLPEILIEHLDEIHQARAFLLTLPECDRTAFILRVQLNTPYAEIARVLQVSETAARVKVHRVRKKLTISRVVSEVKKNENR